MERIEVGRVMIYPKHKRVEVDGVKVKLSSKQWEFVEALALCPRGVVTREYLLACLYPDPKDRPSERSIDMLACYVRRKLRHVLEGANYVHSVASLGYALRA